MKQITQKDLINLIEEKQENARIAYSQTFNMKEGDEAREQAQTNKAYIDAYQDLICYLNGVEIVPEKNNLAQVYSGKKVNVYTKKMIVGSLTPFVSTGKIVKDSGSFIEIQEENGNAIIDKDDIKSIEIVPENKLLEPLCNKCSKTEEACPFHRMGSAYEDCGAFEEQIVTTIPKAKREELGITQDDLKKMVEKTPITPYNEPKVEPLRNDRFRDFENGNFYVSLDAKDVNIITMQVDDRYKTIEISVNGYYVKRSGGIEKYDKEECLAFYKDLIEWRNYWKQN